MLFTDEMRAKANENRRKNLTKNMKEFCLAYVYRADENVVKASEIAGYKGTTQGNYLLRLPKVQVEIDRLRKEKEASLVPIREQFVLDCKQAREKLVLLLDSDSERIRLEACKEILDRGLGKPIQPVIEGRVNPFDSKSIEELRQEILARGISVAPQPDNATESLSTPFPAIVEASTETIIDSCEIKSNEVNREQGVVMAETETTPAPVSVSCPQSGQSESVGVVGSGARGIF